MNPFVRVLPDIASALREGRPVVALESSVLAQGLPIPANREAATRMVGAVQSAGAVAAITAVVKGEPTVGITSEELERFLAREGVRKVSARDLALAAAQKLDGATTVAGSLALAAAVGIEVFATGGIGGVHRGAPFDESADLLELARHPIVTVCAGAKSILDLAATVERLETLGVPIVGYRTDELPGFFFSDTGITLDARANSPAEVAAIVRAHRALDRRQGVIVVQPPPQGEALARETVERAVDAAQAEATLAGVRGGAVTPYLLAALTRLTGGSSLRANLALLEANAALAGEIAKALRA